VKAKSRLEELSIRGLGVIENSSLALEPGFNVLTGETGAGKTMVLTAIDLVLGGKSDSSLVRHGDGRALVSAVFSSSEPAEYCEDGQLILTRSISTEGKSKATAGGVTVTASMASEITEGLIEIHGQSSNSNLVKSSRQRELLDSFGRDSVSPLMTNYQGEFHRFSELKKHLALVKKNMGDREHKIEQLKDFLAQGNKIKPRAGEALEIDLELSRLSSVEDLRIASVQALSLLDEEDVSASSSLGNAKRALDAASGKDMSLDEIATQIGDSLHVLTEALSDLRRYTESLEADPQRLEALQLRKSELSLFLRKYGSTPFSDEALEEIIAALRSARAELNDLTGGDERIHEIENEVHESRATMKQCARLLSEARSRAANTLSELVSHEIHGLAMPHTQFRARVVSPEYSGEVAETEFTLFGCDEIVMEIQSHAGAPFLPINKSASGGELSRIMLALEVVLANTSPVGTYIFDEVDAGVGGSAAIEVGRRLAQLAEQAQVIVVTHLPQVAAWATTHFTVRKESDGSIVSSGVKKLDNDERVEEIARMLAGLGESASAREHAAELLALRSSSK